MVTDNAPWSIRSKQRSVVFDDKLWVAGGFYFDEKESYNDVWYSSDGVDWKQATAAAPWSERHSFPLVVFDDKMWVIGAADRYDVWHTENGSDWIAATPDNNSWLARNGARGEVIDGQIWIFGGKRADGPQSDVWTTGDGLTWEEQSEPAPWLPRWATASAVYKNRIWLVGGWNTMVQPVFQGDVWYLKGF